MSDLTPDSPEVRLVGARLQDEGETIEASAELCARAFSSTPNRLEAVAAEHTRLVAQAVKAARIEALREVMACEIEYGRGSAGISPERAFNAAISIYKNVIAGLIDKEEAK